MVAHGSAFSEIRHYRVDKMDCITVTAVDRDGADVYNALDMGVYAKKVFGIISGTEQKVKLRFENDLVGAVIDRLGRDIPFVPDGDEHFTVIADVVVSP